MTSIRVISLNEEIKRYINWKKRTKKYVMEHEVEKWWDKNDGARDILRHRQFSDDCKRQQQNMDFKNTHSKNYVGNGYSKQSGIALGKKWNELNPKEQQEVRKVYYAEKNKQ